MEEFEIAQVETNEEDLLNKFNWGAFLLGGLWSIAYNQWGWFAIFVILNGISRAVEDSAASLVIFVIYVAVSAFYGSRANKIAWKVSSNKFGSIRRMLEAQVKWIYWGIAINAIVFGASFAIGFMEG